MPPITALDLIQDSFLEAGIFAAGETLPSEDANWGLSKLSRLLDAWDADDLTIYAYSFLQFTLIPNITPLTIGQAAVITSASLTTQVATYISKNSYKVGDYVDTSGCTTAGLNVSNFLVISATPTQFQLNILIADIPSEAEVGALAVYTGITPPNYATTTQRPVKIENGNIVLTNVNPQVNIPLRIHNNKPGGDWWAATSVRNIPTTLPTDLYYSADWPNGSLYLWPRQNTAYGLELECWNNLADIVDLTYQFFLPQGYRNAITYTLAEELLPSYGRPLDPTLQAAGQRYRAKIMELNSDSPMIMTRDPGIPRGAHRSNYFNWLNSQVVPGPR